MTSGKQDGSFLGHGRTPSWPASSGETLPHGNGRSCGPCRAARIARERLAQLETATVAYAQGHCSLYNLFYLAYEKGFAAETLNSKLYKDY